MLTQFSRLLGSDKLWEACRMNTSGDEERASCRDGEAGRGKRNIDVRHVENERTGTLGRFSLTFSSPHRRKEKRKLVLERWHSLHPSNLLQDYWY